MSIKQRKKDHVELVTAGEVDYRHRSGFERYRFLHNALPEVDLDEVSTEAKLLGRTFSFPLFISSMTGGYTEAGAVNALLAEFCQRYDLPLGVGSQRVMLEQPEEASSFSIVREKAPDAFIAANIGGAQLIEGLPPDDVHAMVDSISADAVIVHLNPLQELMQPEGDRRFRGIEEGIGVLAETVDCPLIVKETGAGISAEVAGRLLDRGVSVIDTAGSGGTSWARVENLRKGETARSPFDDWGIPTVECLRQLRELRKQRSFELIASGGIRSPFDIAKSLCLGADFAASAQPVIRAVADGGEEGLDTLFREWREAFRMVMVLLGCRNVGEMDDTRIQLIGGDR